MSQAKSAPKRNRAVGAFPGLSVSAAALARCCDLSKQRVGQLESEGIFVRNAAGVFDLEQNITSYVRYLRDERRAHSRSAAGERAHQARAREIELRIAREEGQLIPIDEVSTGIADILGTYRAELSGVAAASTRDPDTRSAIDHHLNAAISRCRARFEAMQDDLRCGQPVDLDR